MTELEPVSPLPQPAPTDAVRALREAIAKITDDAKVLAEAGDYEGLIRGLEPLQQIIGDLRIVENDVRNFIADTMPERRVTIPGVGTVERRLKITRRNWDSEAILRRLIMQALVDPETGEIPNSPMEAVDKVIVEVKACAPFTGSMAWRTTALRERGFDLDEWCEEHRGGYTVTFSRNKENG
jgi:hypothetical protein